MTTLLAGCVTGRSNEPPVVTLKCPPLVNYSKEKQQKVGEELSKLPPGSALPEVMVDYSKLRDACRAIQRN